jgi:hypothetical protein
MTSLCDRFADLDGEGYGVRLEMAPVHPGLAASAVPWTSGRQFKSQMARAAFSASLIVLTRDKDSGYVSIDATGQPRIHYTVSHRDGRHLMQGLELGVRLLAAAGAVRVGTAQQGLPPLDLSPPYRSLHAPLASAPSTSDAVSSSKGLSPLEATSTAAAHAAVPSAEVSASTVEDDLATYLSNVHKIGLTPYTTGLFSAHQVRVCMHHTRMCVCVCVCESV